MPWKYENNQLISPDGIFWPAISGPFGKGKLPAGEYYITEPVEIKSTAKKYEPYRDKTGFAWWCRIIAQFETERSGFGIHPDGNIPGTLGCIGIRLDNTKEVFEVLLKNEDKGLIVI
ncbi:MAG: murein L,D-transpeptidase [candidate division Zixibacteria bacterium]|nr:murein L,D-transpeptidase [candidate division Zixibacteria bacterium]